MTTSIVLAASKGGQGRTTTAVTLAHLLAEKGQRTLVVDTDAQGNLAEYLGLNPGPGLYQLLVERARLEAVAVHTGRNGLDVVPSDHTTAEVPPALLGKPGFDIRLRRALKGVPYDWLLIDTAPSLSPLHILALMAADWLLVPVELTHGGGLGVAQVLRLVATLKEDAGANIRLAGILPTKLDRRLKESAAQLRALVGHYPKLIWPPIPTDAKAIEAPAFGKTLLEYAPGCSALEGRDVGGELIGGYRQALLRLERTVRA